MNHWLRGDGRPLVQLEIPLCLALRGHCGSRECCERSNVPLFFQSLCAHKISFVQPYTRIHLCLKRRVWNMCKHIFRRDFYVRFKQGRPSPEAMMHFPLFQISPITEKMFILRRKSSQFYLFPKNFRFSSAKISDDLFQSLTKNFEFRPYFSCFSTFPPIFEP